MKRLLLALFLLAAPLAAQPSKYSFDKQVRPGFGTSLAAEATVNLLGDTYCAATATTFGRIAGNTTTTRKFSISLGTGSVSACPVWGALVSGDIPNNAANTSGSAAKWTTARLLAGNSVDGSANATFANKFILQGTTDTGMTAAQFLGALGTGILKNTTTTGNLSIAASGDFPTLNQSTTGNALTATTAETVTTAAQPAITSVGTLAGLIVTAAPTFSALTSGYLPNAGTAGLMGNSPVFTDGTNVGIGMTPVNILDINAYRPKATVSTYDPTGYAEWQVQNDTNYKGGVFAFGSNYYSTLNNAISLRSESSDLNIMSDTALGGGGTSSIHFITSGLFASPSMTITAGGNVGIGAAAFGTSAAGVLGIGNGTAPASSPADMVQLWSEDVSASAELRVRDEAGNVTTLSPHNFSMFTPDKAQVFPWSFYSKNAHIGKEINVDMYGLAAEVEKLSGKKFIYVADLPAGEIEDWTAQEAAKKVTVEKARLDKAMAVEIEVAAKDAAESVPIMKTQESKTLTETITTYALDAASGIAKPAVTVKPKTEQVDTGKTEYRLKAGVRLDEKTGRSWRKTRADEAVVEPYAAKAPPAWMVGRMKTAVK